MSFHTKEAQLIKKKAIAKILGRMYENLELKKAGKKISSSHEPKMYLRMARLLAGTDDSVFIDEVENLLATDADGDKLKNKLRGISERNIPLRRKRILSDRLHHGIPLELMDVLMKQEPDVMLDFLQAAEDDGRYFGDSASNIDNSLQEQSHTAAGDKKTSAFENHPHELGLKGDRRFSAHPQGTAKGLDPKLNRRYKTGKELYQALLPAIQEAEFELQLGIRSDTSRRVVADELLVEEGLLLPGESNWSTEMPDERIKVNRNYLATREPGLQVAAAHNPYLYQNTEDLAQAGISQTDINNWSARNQQRLVKAGGGIRLERLVPGVGLAMAIPAIFPNLTNAKEAYAAGNTEQGNIYAANAGAEAVGAVVGEVPIVGDLLVESVAGEGLADGTLQGEMMRQQQPQTTAQKTADKLFNNPMNELKWAANNPGELLQNVMDNTNVQRGLRFFNGGVNFVLGTDGI